MLLGGISYLVPAIEVAHKHGYHVITVDYLPNNIAHRYSDDYHNVSILDKEAVLSLAKELQIDGILSFAVDPGVVTAAYVAEQMGVPFACSYESACILQDKARFRQFLTDNGFATPNAKGYSDAKEALKDIDYFHWPVIVKPTDSAGSKGVTKVETPEDLKDAIEFALKESHNGRFIIEDFIEKEGWSSGAECFFVDGELQFCAFYDQLFDNESTNKYVPSAECWPSSKPANILETVREQLQRLSQLLRFRTGLFNVEWRVCMDKRVYLMEVSPRAGGNRLAEILNYATGIDIIEAEVSKALGLPLKDIHDAQYDGYYAIIVLHSKKDGIFKGVEVKSLHHGTMLEKEIRVNAGDRVERFSGANNAIGTLFLRFENREAMEEALLHTTDWINIIVE